MIKLVFLLACLAAPSCAQITAKLDMFGLINILYWKADADRDGIISEAELMDIWHGFDANNDQIVTQVEFIPSWSAVTNMDTELSTAYFFLADINDDAQLDNSDLTLVYQRFDINGDGTVTAQEFNLKWQELWREAPFAVLYLRTDANKDDDLQPEEYPKLFASLGSQSNGTGSVSKAKFISGWAISQFGSPNDALTIFEHLDTDSDGSLTEKEVGTAIAKYDLSHNGKIELLELLQIAKLTTGKSR